MPEHIDYWYLREQQEKRDKAESLRLAQVKREEEVIQLLRSILIELQLINKYGRR